MFDKKHNVPTKIMLLSLLSLIQYITVCYYHFPTYTIQYNYPQVPLKSVMTFLIANVFTSAIKNVMTGLKGIWGYRGTLSDITKDTVFVH